MQELKTRKNFDSVISLYNKVGPQALICRFTSGFTFEPQMRYPVLVQISGCALGAVHMSWASPANRADSILSRPMVA